MWDLEQNDNYVLSVDGSGFEAGEVVNCISFNKVKGKTTKINIILLTFSMLGILGAFWTTIYKGNGTKCLLTKQGLFVYHIILQHQVLWLVEQTREKWLCGNMLSPNHNRESWKDKRNGSYNHQLFWRV